MYRVSSYFWSKILTELPMAIVIIILTAVIVYFAIGFNLENWYNFPVFILLSFLSYNAYGGFGLMVGSMISNPALINIIAPVILVPMLLFSGFFVNQDNFPWFLIPLEYISVPKYGYQAFIINEYDGLQLECMKATNPAELCRPLEDFKPE